MNELKKIRLKQRFSNFERAFFLLRNYILLENPSEIERAGGIQFFEMCFELSWKLMKDYLESEGYEVNSPRSAIKQAFQAGVINDGHSWIDGLDDRNLTVHTYDEKTAQEINSKIKNKYYPIILELYSRVKGEV